MPRGSKPGERRGGRAKGTPNHMTADIKAAIENAFTKLGGEDYLVAVARKNSAIFCQLFGRGFCRSNWSTACRRSQTSLFLR